MITVVYEYWIRILTNDFIEKFLAKLEKCIFNLMYATNVNKRRELYSIVCVNALKLIVFGFKY